VTQNNGLPPDLERITALVPPGTVVATPAAQVAAVKYLLGELVRTHRALAALMGTDPDDGAIRRKQARNAYCPPGRLRAVDDVRRLAFGDPPDPTLPEDAIPAVPPAPLTGRHRDAGGGWLALVPRMRAPGTPPPPPATPPQRGPNR
jgi:hypothetical protein